MIGYPPKNPKDILVVIAAISSDIGHELARGYLAGGFRVAGTSRSSEGAADLATAGAHIVRCDLADADEIANAADEVGRIGGPWDVFISAVGDLTPIGPFHLLDRKAWARSVHLNGAAQLQLLHALLPFGRPDLKHAAFLVGGGVNGPFTNFSAYCLGKITLVKACELLHDECSDLHAIAIGTGWVDTKIHRQTIAAGPLAGANLDRTRAFLQDPGGGTSISDIRRCIDWCFSQSRDVTGGRNFSVVHDAWDSADLSERLLSDPHMYKLRRSADAGTR